MKYRKDIDGLRSLAVLPVVLFHLGFPWFSGGYVGVDVFFVISGYLITGLLVAEAAGGDISISGFYERRFRRIVPALLAVVCVTLTIGVVVLLPKDLRNLGRSAAALALGVSNIYFWADGGYFSAAAHERPLLHTWSLSVEEQFYIVLPMMLWWWVVRRKRDPAALMAAAFLFSLAACVWETQRSSDTAYFQLPFRAWELLAGSLLACRMPCGISRQQAGSAAWLGMAGIVISVFAFDPATSFPGYAALLPVTGTVLLLVAGSRADHFWSRFLSLPALVGIGKISYSLYLWHWPVVVFCHYLSDQEPSQVERLLMFVGAIVLSVLSYHLVEVPLRRIRADRRTVIVVTACSLVCMGFAGSVLHFSKGLPQRFDAPPNQDFPGESIYHPGSCFFVRRFEAAAWSEKDCTFAPLGVVSNARVVVWGDSYAAHYVPGLEVLRARTYKVTQLTYAGCGPLNPLSSSDRKDCGQFNEFALRKIASIRPDLVVLSARWNRYRDAEGLSLGLQGTIRRLQSGGYKVLVVGESPTYSGAVPTIRWHLRQGGRDADWVRPSSDFRMDGVVGSVSRSAGVPMFSPLPTLCRDGRCNVGNIGQTYHWDEGHLTGEGSQVLARPLSLCIDRVLSGVSTYGCDSIS